MCFHYQALKSLFDALPPSFFEKKYLWSYVFPEKVLILSLSLFSSKFILHTGILTNLYVTAIQFYSFRLRVRRRGRPCQLLLAFPRQRE